MLTKLNKFDPGYVSVDKSTKGSTILTYCSPESTKGDWLTCSSELVMQPTLTFAQAFAERCDAITFLPMADQPQAGGTDCWVPQMQPDCYSFSYTAVPLSVNCVVPHAAGGCVAQRSWSSLGDGCDDGDDLEEESAQHPQDQDSQHQEEATRIDVKSEWERWVALTKRPQTACADLAGENLGYEEAKRRGEAVDYCALITHSCHLRRVHFPPKIGADQ